MAKADPTEPIVLQVSDFSSREALEKHIEALFGATPDPKNATIEGTGDELGAHYLSHGDTIWGVVAVASDYQPKVDVPRVERGEIHKSKLNGQ